MLSKLVVVLAVGSLLLAACEADIDVNADDESPNPAPTDTAFQPIEEVDECAELSASEGAPATLTAMDNFFNPPCIALSSTQQVAITNAGNQLHNFSVAEGDVDVDIEPGEDVETDEIGTDLSAGTYRFYCEYHEEQGMVGTLVVE